MPRRFTQLPLALLVAAAIATQSLAPPPAYGQPQGTQGLQGGWAIDDKGEFDFEYSTYRQLDLMRQAGAGWVRVNFRLGKCFKNWTTPGCRADGKTAVHVYDQLIREIQARGLKTFGLLSNESSKEGGQAQWNQRSAESTGGNGDNAYVRGFGQNVAGPLATYFNGQGGRPLVTHWEVWNEPNGFTAPRGWPGKVTGGTFIYQSNFAWLLTYAHQAIKGPGANPGATVISGGILSHDSSGLSSGAAYLTSTYNQGRSLAGWGTTRPYPLDGVGQHIYVDQAGTATEAKLNLVIEEIRNAQLPFGDKPIWVTEIGWQTSADQALNLGKAYTSFKGRSYIADTFWFYVQDIPGQHPYGLANASGGLKPAFAAYFQYATY